VCVCVCVRGIYICLIITSSKQLPPKTEIQEKQLDTETLHRLAAVSLQCTPCTATPFRGGAQHARAHGALSLRRRSRGRRQRLSAAVGELRLRNRRGFVLPISSLTFFLCFLRCCIAQRPLRACGVFQQTTRSSFHRACSWTKGPFRCTTLFSLFFCELDHSVSLFSLFSLFFWKLLTSTCHSVFTFF
jgi:hypothetical protein